MSQYRQSLIELVSPYSAGVGVEVGVHKGATSQALLRAFPKLSLWLVDPYQPHPDYPAELQGKHFAEMLERTRFATDRRFVLKLRSTDAVKTPEISDALFDFVFIDADHSYESVKADLAAWWPRVKPGGLFCGHDYGKKEYGVTEAVDEWYADCIHDMRNDKVHHIVGSNIWWAKRPA